jgi:tRNA A-37 threonylcarbamoyl transferase component Bud32
MQEHDDYSGRVLDGRYRVDRLLGRGGMGAVYEGRHAIVGKRVAIKMLHAEFAANEEVLRRFYREAQAAAAIGHKNIIDIMDVGVTPANEPYIVMEYLEGEDLEGMLVRTGPLGLEAACGILEPALNALAAAHSKGIVHRDLKPANIFLCHAEGGRPTVKLIDFGISKFSGGTGTTKLTQTGSLLGTPAYMSPEQARGDQSVDHRTDVYSVGVILYQMLTGALPFVGDNYNTLLISVLTGEPRPLRELNPGIPADAEALVLKELNKDPAARSQSAIEMLEAFKGLAAYKQREMGMSLLGTQLQRGVAGGDLGGSLASGGSSASRVLSQMAKATPGAWSGTAAKRGPRPALVVGLVAAALIVGAAAVFFLVKGSGAPVVPILMPPMPLAPPPAALPATEPKPAPARVVSIRVTGAPESAEILFDGAAVPTNPFSVEPREGLVKLEVRVPGYRAFATMIAPSEDREVVVSLEPAEKAGGSAKKGVKGSHGAQETKKGTGASDAAGAKLKEGKRGTKFGDSFE